MYLDIKTARKLINMNPFPKKGYIDKDVAERQFQVVINGFNHLIQPQNNFLYIADEVGLGKTYIALGIASLLRHFSDHPESYIDTIIVPKQNLQFKWLKEIRNFASNNYTRQDNIVRSVIDKPVGKLDESSIIHKLQPIAGEQAQYVLMRNSSFSLASDRNEENEGFGNWIKRLSEKLPEEQRKIFDIICKQHRRNDIVIKRAFAILLNTLLPKIDLLIVDEAHNYKHGVSENVSIRNQIVSRILGSVNLDQEFYENSELEILKDLYSTQKVSKLLLLSATPIDNGLSEIRNQLDVFLNQHRFTNTQEELLEKEIENDLNKFLMRGVMHLKVNNEEYSRNCYRHEHRNGNVTMAEQAVPQTLTDDKTTAILGLMQYKTIKELKLKSNNSFEMGMLAGFESFEGTSEYENKTVDDKSVKDAKDEHIIEQIVKSYHKKFGKFPPHPKQESLVNELFDLMIRRVKSLVFVRRIASVREIERQLFQKYSDHLIQKITNVKGRKRIHGIDLLIQSYNNDSIRDDIEKALDRTANRIYHAVRDEILEIAEAQNHEIENALQILNSDLRDLYNAISEDKQLNKFRELIKNHSEITIVRQELKDISIKLLHRKWNGELEIEEEDEDEISISESKLEEEKAPYFFQRFFYNEGKSFKKRSYTKNWYELNYLLINDYYQNSFEEPLFKTNNEIIVKDPDLSGAKTDVKKFEIIQKKIEQAIKNKNKSTSPIHPTYRTKTFLTSLLIDLCHHEFNSWILFQKKKIRGNQYTEFIEELESLNEILKSIFRQGSGLLPAFLAEAMSNSDEEFISIMKQLLQGEFKFILDEIKDIIRDYDKLVERNFDHRDRIRYNLIQQLPVAGVSGHHKKDVRKTAIQFRMPGYPYILIATDILKEGEDLHTYCSNIYHYGIAWNPSDMEQRTGRIDRIDSLAYNKIMQAAGLGQDKISFENKLQVFFPYLADTLEVNQMVKLFNGMAEFIELFYSDISKEITKEATADVDELVIDIPTQKTGLLVSKYDYKHFQSDKASKDSLNIKDPLGVTKEHLKQSMRHLIRKLNEHANDFIIEPEFDKHRLIISGVMLVNGNRNGPFKIYYDHDELPGNFVLCMESCLGRVQIFGRQSNMQHVEQKLSGKNIFPTERNSFIWTRKNISDYENTESVYQQLVDLVYITDELEESIAGEDAEVEL